LGKLNPKIDNISISKDKLVSLKKAIQHYEGMNGQISDIIKKIVGGVCIICHGIPVKKLTYQMVSQKLNGIVPNTLLNFKKMHRPINHFRMNSVVSFGISYSSGIAAQSLHSR